MYVGQIEKGFVLNLGFLGIWVSLLPVEAAVRFTHHPPSVLYVQTGQTARFVWDYTVDNRNKEFGLNSPEWGFYDSNGNRLVICNEDGLQGWQWVIDYRKCPARLLSPTVRVSKESTATLVISNATTADNGVYECTLVLSAGSPIVSKVQLIVTVSPQFNPQPPLTKNIAEGQELSVSCTAIGLPTPNITWVQIVGHVVKSTGTGSATLRIPNIRRDQNGTYECQAKNNPNERPVTTRTVVKVYYKPSIDDKSSSNYKSWNGNNISLRCFATGLPAPRISWYKPTNQQITTGVNIVPGGSEVTILTTADQGDYGQYKCRATNILGSDEHVITVSRLFPPGPVTITMTEAEASSITVRWTKAADDGGINVTAYLLEVSTKPPVITVNTHTVITGLKANTLYTVKVYAENAVGYGQVSLRAITTKKIGKPPVPKLSAVLNHTSGLTVILRWKNQNNDVDQVIEKSKYSVYKKDVFQSDWMKIDDIVGNLPLAYTISKNVTCGKTYQFIVTAWNRYGESVKNEMDAVTINIPIYEDKDATDIGKQRQSSEDNQNVYSPAVIGVLATIAVLSLGINMLEYMSFRRKMKVFMVENTEKTIKRNQEQPSKQADQVYDNVIEMTNKIPSSAADQPDSIGSANQVTQGQAIEHTMARSTPCQTPAGVSSQSRKKDFARQDNTRPVYEPLRRTVQQHHDNEPYQPLGVRNQNSTYQSLNASGKDTVMI